MRIKDIALADVARGANWRLIGAQGGDWVDEPMEEWPIEPAPSLRPEDKAVYSGVYVLENGQVRPLLLVKEVGTYEYGGDYCEHVDGKWRQVGLEPDPNAPYGQEYIANPSPEDPSFCGDVDHAWHTKNFAIHVVRMRRA